MKCASVAVVLCLASFSYADLVARWKGDDSRDSLGRNRLSFVGDAKANHGRFEFAGSPSDVAFVPDSPEFAITGSISISCWVCPRAFASPFATSPQSQIVFRGDDRGGSDPYHLTLSRDGCYTFSVDGGISSICTLGAPARLNEWVHLLGTLDATTGEMQLFVNSRPIARAKTDVRPTGALDRRYHPGIGIGNTQFPQGGHHQQPFDGFIRDVRIYNSVVSQRTASK